MPADGLTKALPSQKHREFIRQLGLVDIEHQIARTLMIGTNVISFGLQVF